MLIKKKEDIFYLTGEKFHAGFLLLKKQGEHAYIGDGLERSKTSVNYEYKDLSKLIGKLKKLQIDDSLLASELEWIKKIAPKTKIEIIRNPLLNERIIKDRDELSSLRAAYKITLDVFENIKPFIRTLPTELSLANLIKIEGLKRGVVHSFEPIVASGVNSSIPHHHPTSKRLRKNESITLDFGFVYNGYVSDFTRTVFVGEPKGGAGVIYESVRRAYVKARDAASVGMLGKELDAVARGCIAQEGYGEHFIHSLGHGSGLEVHEPPSVGPNGEDELSDGMVFSIEPGIYTRGKYGVRIEDLFYLDGSAKYFGYSSIELKDNIL